MISCNRRTMWLLILLKSWENNIALNLEGGWDINVLPVVAYHRIFSWWKINLKHLGCVQLHFENLSSAEFQPPPPTADWMSCFFFVSLVVCRYFHKLSTYTDFIKCRMGVRLSVMNLNHPSHSHTHKNKTRLLSGPV